MAEQHPPADPESARVERVDEQNGGVRPTSASITRRGFLKGASGLAAGGAVAASAAGAPEAAPEAAERTAAPVFAGKREIKLVINGQVRAVEVEPRTTLLSALRDHMDPPLTGTKEVCDRGSCGACTVMLEGKTVYSCMQLAASCEGREITTIEGLGTPGDLSVVQDAFWQHDASMCGFCTPGFVMSVTACLERNPRADEEEIGKACSGNLCRCGTYPHILRAAQHAGQRMQGEKR